MMMMMMMISFLIAYSKESAEVLVTKMSRFALFLDFIYV